MGAKLETHDKLHSVESPTPDAATRLWSEIEVAHFDFAKNKAKLGRLFFELRNLYSERNSGGRRLTSGHGQFEQEIKERGFKPRRVREWINDHEIVIGLRAPAESTAAKRRARRVKAVPAASTLEDPVSRFAALLPFAALKASYRAALHELHPDHGGSEEATRNLIRAWEAVERLHSPVVDVDVEECVTVN